MKQLIVAILALGLFATAHAEKSLLLKTGKVSSSAKIEAFNLASESNLSRQYVVQFDDSLKANARQWLVTQGLEVHSYIPEDAFLVTATASQLHQIISSGARISVYAYKASMKLSPEFSMSIFNADHPTLATITLVSKKQTQTVKKNLLARGAALVGEGERTLIVSVATGLLPQISELSGIEFIERYMPIEIMSMDLGGADVSTKAAGDYSDLTGFESGTKLMNFSSVWARGYRGEGEVVGVADTGFDTGDPNTIHKDLGGAVKKGFIHGLFAKSWADPQGHGTHVAGSVLGRGAESQGALAGGANAAQLIAQGMWSPMMNNLTVPAKLSDLFSQAYQEGARVHSNSWGSPVNLGAYTNMSLQVDEFMWNNPEMLIVFAAGNSGVDTNKDGRIDEDSVSSPGTAKNALTVGASENTTSIGGIQKNVSELNGAAEKWGAEPIRSSKISDNGAGIAMFSSRGPTDDGRLKPEVVAPGTNILSLLTHQEGATQLWGAYNHHYAWAGGTSMATPLTAGAAAVTREYLQKSRKLASPSAAVVKATLMVTAFDLFPGQYGTGAAQEIRTQRPEMNEGFGRVDMAKISAISTESVVVDEKDGVAQGEEKTYSVQVQSKLSVVVAWTDAPAASSASSTLVNDLDLAVQGPSGQSSSQWQDIKNIDNHAHLDLKDLTPGTYTIRVKGLKVPQGKAGKQAFGLAAITE